MYRSVRLSPDAERVAVTRRVSGRDEIWSYEFARNIMTRMSFDEGGNRSPVWSPDNRQIAFGSARDGPFQLYRKTVDGGAEELLTGGPYGKILQDWSADGQHLLYLEEHPQTYLDLWALPLQGDRKPIPVLRTPFADGRGRFSPDGKWIAYGSSESGANETYVRSFPSSGDRLQVSTQTGLDPVWRGDGRELFYIQGGNLVMAVGIQARPGGLQIDAPRELFSTSIVIPVIDSRYDVTADGQRFLVLERVGGNEAGTLTVLANWEAGLRRE
jgi:Tol biopolymer transport system component